MSATLVLNASPHVDGHTMRLARAVADQLPGGIDTAHLYRMDIKPCTACGVCDASPHCPLRDSVAELRGRLERCSRLIIASPLYFVSLTAPLVALYSRLQPYWMARRRGEELIRPGSKAAALVVTGGSQYRDMFGPARAVTAALLNSLGIAFTGMATAADTDAVPVADNLSALAAAAELGRRLAEAAPE